MCNFSNSLIIENHVTYVVSDKPNKPQDLRATDVMDKSVVLRWKKPEDDGGTSITGTIICFDKFSFAQNMPSSFTYVLYCI